MGSGYLLDTNHVSPLMQGDANLERRLLASTSRTHLCRPSIGELWFGVYNGRRMEANRRRLEQLLTSLDVLEYDAAAAENFGQLMAELRRLGRPIPHIDVQIAAVARTHSLVVLTADQHFSLVPGLDVENWLA